MDRCPVCGSTKMVPMEEYERDDRICRSCGQRFGPHRLRSFTGKRPVWVKLSGWIRRLLTYPMSHRFRRRNIHVGREVTIARGFRFLWGNMIVGDHVALQNTFCDDSATITIGPHSFFGHNVRLLTPYHDMECLDADRRRVVRCRPITIGKGVWIASNAMVLAGVTIGDGAVVGAGAVVTKDVPSMSFVGGNPAKIIRRIGATGTDDRSHDWVPQENQAEAQ